MDPCRRNRVMDRRNDTDENIHRQRVTDSATFCIILLSYGNFLLFKGMRNTTILIYRTPLFIRSKYSSKTAIVSSLKSRRHVKIRSYISTLSDSRIFRIKWR
jgi:hypothetical protein